MTSREARIQMGRALRNAVGLIMDDIEPLEKLEAGLTNGFEYRFCNNPSALTEVSLRTMRNFDKSLVWDLRLSFHFRAYPFHKGPRPLGCVPEAMAFAEAAIAAAQAMPRIEDDD